MFDILLQVLLGDVGAGKSSLVLRFVKGQFIEFQVGSVVNFWDFYNFQMKPFLFYPDLYFVA